MLAMLRWLAHRALPSSMRQLLVGAYFRLEDVVRGPLELRFAKRPAPIRAFHPAFPTREFRAGPIVLVNQGLAPGGVERQIVNTLLALDTVCGRKLGLLGLRIGSAQELEFFRPALTGFSGFVRNAASISEARRMLRARVSPSVLRGIDRQIAWMPWDIKEEIIRLAAEFAVLRPSVVHGWQDGSAIQAAYAGRLIGVPRILISVRNVRPTNFAWYRPHMYHSYCELVDCPGIIMINNSQAGAADYAQWLDLPVDRLIVKRNGLNVSTLRRPDPAATACFRAKLGIPVDAPVVGSIYRFYAEKRPLLWIEAAREIARVCPQCHFIIFGEGPMRAEIEIAGANGLVGRLHCPGTIPDVALGLSILDVFLLTSRAEGTPNVILEASALGVPVVATNAGGIPETIEDGVTGHLVNQADPQTIAHRVQQILQTPEWRASVRTTGPNFVASRFGLDRMVAETLALYGLR
jgi:glycosyltransferase involved in cell wall biosynthesis